MGTKRRPRDRCRRLFCTLGLSTAAGVIADTGVVERVVYYRREDETDDKDDGDDGGGGGDGGEEEEKGAEEGDGRDRRGRPLGVLLLVAPVQARAVSRSPAQPIIICCAGGNGGEGTWRGCAEAAEFEAGMLR